MAIALGDTGAIAVEASISETNLCHNHQSYVRGSVLI